MQRMNALVLHRFIKVRLIDHMIIAVVTKIKIKGVACCLYKNIKFRYNI